MRLSAWRIRKVRVTGKWVVLAPGSWFAARATCDSHADAVQMLAQQQRWAARGFQ